ncbi:MAG: hypothetical protein HY935_05885 [Nitrosomonadales bacterium]|nr:hypothetical protein [Nitrosomonadales bacterium]
MMCGEKESTQVLRSNWCRSRERQERIEKLEGRIWKILEVDFSAPIDSEKKEHIRMEEKVINSGLAALRLQQGEHRLANNLAIAILAFLSAIAGGIVGYMLH